MIRLLPLVALLGCPRPEAPPEETPDDEPPVEGGNYTPEDPFADAGLCDDYPCDHDAHGDVEGSFEATPFDDCSYTYEYTSTGWHAFRVYDLDEHGQVVHTHEVYEGADINLHDMDYYGNGELHEQIYTGLDDDVADHRIHQTLTAWGAVAERVEDEYADGRGLSWSYYRYDDDQRLIGEDEDRDGDGDFERVADYTYGTDGEVATLDIAYDTGTTVHCELTQELTEDGTRTTRLCERSNGPAPDDWSVFEYDADGRVVYQAQGYDADDLWYELDQTLEEHGEFMWKREMQRYTSGQLRVDTRTQTFDGPYKTQTVGESDLDGSISTFTIDYTWDCPS